MSNLTKIHIEKKGLETILSTLESDIMKILWKRSPIKVKELHELLKKKHKVAQTSIAVTMDRLYEKRIVDREIESGRGGLHYLYYPSKSKLEFEKTILDQTVNKLMEAFGPTAVSYFDERFKKGATNSSKSKRKD